MNLPTKLRTAWRLGPRNIVRLAAYRGSLRFGLSQIRRIKAQLPRGPYFEPPVAIRDDLVPTDAWTSSAAYFGHLEVPLAGGVPDWHRNPFSGCAVVNAERRPWWDIPDFDPEVGDIKFIWEPSRFDWVVACAQRAAVGGGDLEQLNAWLDDWCRNNPCYYGPNWKCGQEASIRIMHLAVAAMILDSLLTPTNAVLDLVEAHLRRILPTRGYAIAQDNNHGTSEAAALFIGGCWLDNAGIKSGERYAKAGRNLLEERVARLFQADGGFSQSSLNYHRLALDTLSIAETFRRRFKAPAFSRTFQARAEAASAWLFAMVDPATGDGPNTGANDGSRIIPLSNTPYRDYRPTVQLASVLFTQRRSYPAGSSADESMRWLGMPDDYPVEIPKDQASLDQGGFKVLQVGNARAIMRIPRARFRPAQADALHLDLWVGGQNLLRDAGSYGYNVDIVWQKYFKGTAAHNTIEMDGRDQMPRLGRFLFGDWLDAYDVEGPSRENGVISCAASYRDRQGVSHVRLVQLGESSMRVTDSISGFQHKAVIRWRLQPGDWTQKGNQVMSGTHTLRVEAETPIVRAELVEGWESKYYMDKSTLPVFEVEVHESTRIMSEYRWAE